MHAKRNSGYPNQLGKKFNQKERIEEGETERRKVAGVAKRVRGSAGGEGLAPVVGGDGEC